MKQPQLRVDGLTVEELIQLVVNNRQAIALMAKTYNESTSSSFKRTVTSKIRQHEMAIKLLQTKIRDLEAV